MNRYEILNTAANRDRDCKGDTMTALELNAELARRNQT